ncbi:MAG: hypothetical protein NZM37_13070, partial [Sandaracinaceae bacterium]|nr:hypothetical protein [Sandaracinaceae bacterium]
MPSQQIVPRTQREGGRLLSVKWTQFKERGTTFGIKLLVFLARVAGRRVARKVVSLIALYYALFYPSLRKCIYKFYNHLGEKGTFLKAYLHINRFCQCLLDSFFMVSGMTHYFSVERHGNHHLLELKEKKKGAILLSAHVGSFYALRMLTQQEELPVRAIAYTKNARKINQVLSEIDPSTQNEIIEIEEETANFALRIRDLVED